MNNIKKIGLSALAGSLAMVSANAVEYTMSGGMVVTMTNGKGDTSTESVNGRGLGSATDLSFNASGELDNGFTVGYFMGVDTHGALSNTSSQMTIGMGSLGTLQYNNKFGSKSNGIDDIGAYAYNETWDGLNTGLAGDNPSWFGASSNGGSVDYRIPATTFEGVTVNASVTYDPQASTAAASKGGVSATNPGSSTAYTLQFTEDTTGIEIGLGHEDINDEQSKNNAANKTGTSNANTGYIKYAVGGLSLAYQMANEDKIQVAARESTMISAAYTMGDLTFSYGESTIDKEDLGATTSTVDVENESIQVAYVMGAMTVSGAMSETKNSNHVAGNKFEQNTLAVSFAF